MSRSDRSKRRDMLPLWTDAYLADTTHLDLEHHGAYFLLIMKAWRDVRDEDDAPSLPDDDMFLRNTLSITQKKWLVLKPYIMALWTLEDKRWTQKKLTKAWQDHKDFVVEQKRRRREGRGKTQKSSSPRADHSTEKSEQKQRLGGDHTVAEAVADITDTKVSAETKKKRRRKKAALPLPENWKPEPISQKLKDELKLSQKEYEHEYEQFKNHAAANDRRQVDWQAAWRTWLKSPYGTYGRRIESKSRQSANGSNASRNGSKAAGLGGAFERELEARTSQSAVDSYIDVTPSPDDADGRYRLGFDDDA